MCGKVTCSSEVNLTAQCDQWLDLSSPVRIIWRCYWISRSDSSIYSCISTVFNTSSRLLVVASAASDYKILFLASLSLEWVLLRSSTLLMCLPSISLLWVGYGITISVLIPNSVLMSWPRVIPMFWTIFSHVVRISPAEFFSTYVNIDLPRAFNIPKLSFSLMELICFPLPEWLPMPLPELLPLQEPSPLPEPPLPIPMAVDCRH